MSSDDAILPNHWLELALQELQAARLLAKGAAWQQSFQHAGFALECALKYRIMRFHGLNRWPDRADKREFYTHDLPSLAEAAGLVPLLQQAVLMREPIGRAWMIAKDWRNEMRYDPKPFPQARGADMLWAVDEMRLVSWLLNL